MTRQPSRTPSPSPEAHRPDSKADAPAAAPRRDRDSNTPWAVWLVFILVTVGTLAIEYGGRALALSEYTHVTLAALFLMVAIQAAQRSAGGLPKHGLWLGGLLEPSPEPASPGPLGGLRDLLSTLRDALPSAARETAVALGTAALTFPPFIMGFYLYHAPTHPFVLKPMDAPVDYLLSQLLVVALPEEALFRGYLQTQLVRHFPGHGRFPWFALAVQALLFAILHFVVNLDPSRLSVFFPALLFGLLRELRGGIGAALVYHALCNLLGDLLVRGFL